MVGRTGFRFTVGFVAGILLLSFSGRYTLTKSQFPEIKRFWSMQSPTTNFFPTIRQQLVWAKQQTSKDKITVIFGGSSFLLGTGQPVEKSTAAYLQKILGSEYSVINLAVRGGGAFGQGLYVASKLKKEGYRVVFVSDINPGYAPPFENDGPYAYSYWQARYSNYLWKVPSDEMEIPNPNVFSKKSLLAFLNKYLYVQELANYISYNFIKFNNSSVAGLPSLSPLRTWEDREIVIPYEERHLDLNVEKAHFELALTYAKRDYITDENYREVALKYRNGINRAGGMRTILISCESNPRYLKPISKELLFNYYSIIDKQIEAMRAVGLEAHTGCRDFKDQDYGDIIHLVPSGAEKLATKIASWIENERFYDKE